MTDKDSLGKLALITFIGGAIGRLLQYILHVIIARGLGPGALGIFSFGSVLLKIGMTVGRAGLDQAVQKYVPIYSNEDTTKMKRIISFSILSSFVIGAAVALMIFTILYLGNLSQLSDDVGVYLFLLAIPFMSAMMVGIAASKAFFETKYAVYTKDFIQSGLSVLFVAFGTYIVGTSVSVMLGYVLSVVFGMFAIVYYLNNLDGVIIRGISKINHRSIFRFSVPLMLVAVSSYLVNWTDVLMLGILSPAAAIGKYQAAFQTTALLGFVLFSVNSIFPPVASSGGLSGC